MGSGASSLRDLYPFSPAVKNTGSISPGGNLGDDEMR